MNRIFSFFLTKVDKKHIILMKLKDFCLIWEKDEYERSSKDIQKNDKDAF